MKKFLAITESGGRYESDGHTVKITSGSGNLWPTVIKPWNLFSVPEQEGLLTPERYLSYHNGYNYRNAESAEQFKELYGFEVSEEPSPYHEVDAPVLGERFYVGGKDEWRLSTVVVSLELR